MGISTRSTKLLMTTMVVVLLTACASRPPVNEDGKRGAAQSHSMGSSRSVAVPEKVKRTYQSALNDIQHKDYNKAEVKLQAISTQMPALATPQINLGILYYQQGKLAEAEKVLQLAVKANPDIPQAYNYLGIVYREQGKFKQAEQAYIGALSLNPNYAIVHRNLGILYDLYLKNYGKAAQHYARYSVLTSGQDKDVQAWLLDLQQRTRATASN